MSLIGFLEKNTTWNGFEDKKLRRKRSNFLVAGAGNIEARSNPRFIGNHNRSIV